MGPSPVAPQMPRLRRLTTPRAAAWAGVVFAVLFGLSLILVRLAIPADPFAEPSWIAEGTRRIRWAMALLPLSGIAFLWFIGVVRDRLGAFEDRFLASVFLGSGLLFLAMAFVSTAIAGAILTSSSDPGSAYDPAVLGFARAAMLQISNVYALRMAAAFMISLGTIWLRTGLMPRWLGGLTYALALVLLVVTTFSLWTTLVFPAWVLLVSVVFLVWSFAARTEADAGA